MSVAGNTKKSRKSRARGRKKEVALLPLLRRIAGVIFLLLLLGASMFMVGYVIFFRTVVAQEIVPSLRNSIVFEEPNPPPMAEKIPELAEPRELPQEPPTEPKTLPKVAIIIDDLGYDEGLFRRLLQLPYPLTFSFLPFAPLTPQLEKEAYFAGRVVFLHLPLEPRGEHYNPGPGALFLSDPSPVQREKLGKAVAMVPHAIGVNNHMGSRFTEDQAAMDNVLARIKDKGLIYVDSVTSAQSVAYRTARELGLRSLRRNVFLDNELDTTLICQQLAKLVAVAEKKGEAIGIAHPHEETVLALEQCLPLYDEIITVSSIPALLP